MVLHGSLNFLTKDNIKLSDQVQTVLFSDWYTKLIMLKTIAAVSILTLKVHITRAPVKECTPIFNKQVQLVSPAYTAVIHLIVCIWLVE